MKQQLRENRWFYIPFILFVIGLSVVVGLYHSKDVVLFLNGMEHIWLQSFFYLMTLMGEWVGGLIVALILLWHKPLKYTLVFLIAVGLASGTSGLLKETVFHDVQRPAASFEEELIVVHGTDLHKNHSFPSGHTTAAFCMFGFLALSMRSRAWQVCGILVGVSVGLSRMFLGQHYPEDVLAGAILGTVLVSFVYRLVINVTGGELLNKRLINDK